jgi:hypothetical protein
VQKRTLPRSTYLAAIVCIATSTALLSGCGRQVSPNAPGVGAGGALPGQMSVTFSVAAPFDFSNFQYWLVFDTSGDLATPSTVPANNNWAGYSDGIEISGSGGATSAAVYQFAKNASQPKAQPAFLTILPVGQNFIYLPGSNGLDTQFTVVFDRSLFTSRVKNPQPLAKNWTFNAFTTQANVLNQLTFEDSLGSGGKNDPQFNSPVLDTSQCFDIPNYARYSGLQLNPAGQIVNVEVSNNPSSGC